MKRTTTCAKVVLEESYSVTRGIKFEKKFFLSKYIITQDRSLVNIPKLNKMRTRQIRI